MTELDILAAFHRRATNRFSERTWDELCAKFVTVEITKGRLTAMLIAMAKFGLLAKDTQDGTAIYAATGQGQSMFAAAQSKPSANKINYRQPWHITAAQEGHSKHPIVEQAPVAKQFSTVARLDAYLADLPRGSAVPGTAIISTETGIHPQNVRRGMRILADDGKVIMSRQYGTGTRTVTEWRV